MKKEEIIEKTVEYVQETLHDAEGGHDWWHILRVWNLAKRIAQDEAVDELVVELGALLHDIADSKFHGGDETIGPRRAESFLKSLSVDTAIIEHVVQIIRHISFKGGQRQSQFQSKELQVLQDADRLDAIGAIGIARCFNYGGYKNRALYDPNVPAQLNMTAEEYKNNKGPSINHFYEKLLRLKDGMHTATGRQLAAHRHQYLLDFLDEFYAEWHGER